MYMSGKLRIVNAISDIDDCAAVVHRMIASTGFAITLCILSFQHTQ